MRIVVTGASGFIAGHLARGITRGGAHEAILVSRRQVPAEGRNTLVTADLAEPRWTERLPARADAVIHLAQSRRFREFPAGAPDVFAVNTRSTAELLDWAAGAGVRRFVLASTGSVYAEQQRPLVEEDPTSAAGFYAASKLAAEALAEAYQSVFPVAALRLFSPYGPGQAGMLLANIVERVRAGEEVQVAGGVGLYLTPLFVRDCVEALLRVAGAEAPPPWRIYNVAGGEVVTLADVARTVARVLGVEPRIADTPGQPRWIAAGIARIGQELGWRPDTPLDEGLRLTAAGHAAP